MSEQFDALQRRVSGLERMVLLLAMCCAALTIFLLLFAARGVVKAAAQPEMLTVKRLAVVDEKGTERLSRTPRVLARLHRMVPIHVRRLERPSKPSICATTAIQVSCTTSSAAAGEPTNAAATRRRPRCIFSTSSRNAASSPARRRLTSTASSGAPAFVTGPA